MADRMNFALASVARHRKGRAACVAFVVGALGSTYILALSQIIFA